MNQTEPNVLTVQTSVKGTIEHIWECWNSPEHIVGWYFANEDWCAPSASNDLHVGGRFKTRMEAKDGSMGFDFEGIYLAVEPHQLIRYQLEDMREVSIEFKQTDGSVEVIERFDPETINPHELQVAGWQAILNQFKVYVESL